MIELKRLIEKVEIKTIIINTKNENYNNPDGQSVSLQWTTNSNSDVKLQPVTLCAHGVETLIIMSLVWV